MIYDLFTGCNQPGKTLQLETRKNKEVEIAVSNLKGVTDIVKSIVIASSSSSSNGSRKDKYLSSSGGGGIDDIGGYKFGGAVDSDDDEELQRVLASSKVGGERFDVGGLGRGL